MKFAALILLLSISLVADAFEPTMSVNVETPLTPVVHGVTNLPDGANLMLTLTRPDVQYAGQSKMVVKNGRFQSQRLTYRGKPLTPGQYKIDISMAAAAFNPSNVRSVIGSRGERMTGPFVVPGMLDEHEFLFSTLIDLGGPADSTAEARARTERNDHLELAVIRNCKQSVDVTNVAIEAGAAQGVLSRGEAYRQKVRECIRTAARSNPAAAELIVERYDGQ